MRIQKIIVQVAALAALIVLGFASCSVKEDRSVCPMYVYIRSDAPLPEGTDALVTVFHEDDGMVYQMKVPSDILYPDGLEVRTHRGAVSANVLAGIRDMTVFNGVAKIQTAFQTDSLYRFSVSGESMDEECVMVGSPLKEFSVLTLRLNDTQNAYSFRLLGVWDRIYGTDFKPGKGNYTFVLNDDFIPAGSYECLLSRQGDDSLSLEVYEQENLDVPYKVLPLGKLMVRAGYDIAAVPMEDVTVDVDLTKGVVSVTIGDWEAVEFMIYTI